MVSSPEYLAVGVLSVYKIVIFLSVYKLVSHSYTQRCATVEYDSTVSLCLCADLGFVGKFVIHFTNSLFCHFLSLQSSWLV